MSDGGQPKDPRLVDQTRTRNALRIFGFLLGGAGLVCTTIAAIDFFAAFGRLSNPDPWETIQGPTKSWLFFVGIPLMAVGGWCLQAGFMGVAARESTAAFAGSSSERRFCGQCGKEDSIGDRLCRTCGGTLG